RACRSGWRQAGLLSGRTCFLRPGGMIHPTDGDNMFQFRATATSLSCNDLRIASAARCPHRWTLSTSIDSRRGGLPATIESMPVHPELGDEVPIGLGEQGPARVDPLASL